MPTFSKEPKIIGLITPDVLKNSTFLFEDEIALCDILEIRYDLFEDPMQWKSLAARVRKTFPKKEIIGTIRLTTDGGAFDERLVEKRNSMLYELMLLGDWDWVDIEYEQLPFLLELLKGARESNTQVITSHHNFNNAYCKEQYVAMAMDMTLAGSDAVKFAVMAKSPADVEALYEFIEENSERTIPLPLISVFSMGTIGQETRYRSPSVGAPFTYGFFGKIAPVSGQISVKELYKMLKKG